ncbi:MAG: DUF3616 domain-containing protein [Pseudomonadota bacterium]
MRVMRGLTPALLILLAACSDTGGEPALLEAGITIAGHFGEDGDASEDVSGLACDWQDSAPEMRCLAIEDEGREAQWASFDGAILRAGQRFDLLGVGAPLGTAPDGICSDADSESDELDGEAAAFSDGAFYISGSHGCSRESDEYRPASFVVVRIAPDEPRGEILPGSVSIVASHRLSGMIQRDPVLAPFFGTSLMDADGLNIEGLAVRGERMVFGLRAPVIDGRAFLFETSVTALFSPDIVGPGRAGPIALGTDTGIRDLAFLPDGRLLILSGPAQDQPLPYHIHLHSGDGTAELLATVEAPRGGKAEAMAVVGVEADRVSLLVLFDGADDGAPIPMTIALPD